MTGVVPLDFDPHPAVVLADHGFVLLKGHGALVRRRWGREVRQCMTIGVPVEISGKALIEVEHLEDGRSASYQIDGGLKSGASRMMDLTAKIVAGVGIWTAVLATVHVAKGPVAGLLLVQRPATQTTQGIHEKIASEAEAGTPGFSRLAFETDEQTAEARRVLDDLKEEAR